MRPFLLLLPIIGALVTPTIANSVFEFDGESWTPKPTSHALKKAENKCICLIADSSTPMAHFEQILNRMKERPPKTLKLQLGDQFQSVILDLPRAGQSPQEEIIAILTGPAGSYLLKGSPHLGSLEPVSKLGVNLDGIQAFLNQAAKYYKTDNDREQHTLTAFATRSTCTMGQFITVAQLLQQSGMGPAFIWIDDQSPDLDFEIKMDQRVKIPITKQPDPKTIRLGRIIININAKGRISTEDETILDGDEAIATFFKEQKALMDKNGVVPKVHLHGEKSSLFSHARTIIKLAAKAGLNEVIFVSYDEAALLRDKLRKKEFDLDMALPSSAPKDSGMKDLDLMFIKIDAAGQVFINSGPAQEKLDTDLKSRNLPLLSARMESLASAAKASGSQALVRLYVESKAPRQRVTDVLNVLASHKIEKVDLVNAE